MYQYFAVPTQDSLERLKEIFSSSPVPIDFDKIVVRLGSSQQQSTTRRAYRAQITWFGHHYNQELEYTELVGMLDSPEMTERHGELDGSYDGDFEPMVIFQSPATPLAQTNKFFLNSVANTLVSREDPFTFVERVLSS
jgi:hypothetical protein